VAVAEIDGHRHGPAAADQHEGHDGDQDERDVLSAIVSAKTSLGLGQGTVVDMRAVMYDSRKQPKMKVSLRRKIHIMAFPQETFLNAR
jgi:hypothetical protein